MTNWLPFFITVCVVYGLYLALRTTKEQEFAKTNSDHLARRHIAQMNLTTLKYDLEQNEIAKGVIDYQGQKMEYSATENSFKVKFL